MREKAPASSEITGVISEGLELMAAARFPAEQYANTIPETGTTR
jgi:hypothetical protein